MLADKQNFPQLGIAEDGAGFTTWTFEFGKHHLVVRPNNIARLGKIVVGVNESLPDANPGDML